MNTAAVMAKTNAKSTTGRHCLLDNYSSTGGDGRETTYHGQKGGEGGEREPVVKVDRRIRWHYTTTRLILRLRIGA